MASTKAEVIWGIGPRITEQLGQLRAHTALDVARMDPPVVRKRWLVVLERTLRRIQGLAYIALPAVAPAKKETAVPDDR